MDRYLSRLIQMIEDEISAEKYQSHEQPDDIEIDQLLNNICAELKLSIRFKSLDTGMVRITCKDISTEYLLFPEVVARFREEYCFLVIGPELCE
jgi:hypothetical protein